MALDLRIGGGGSKATYEAQLMVPRRKRSMAGLLEHKLHGHPALGARARCLASNKTVPARGTDLVQ